MLRGANELAPQRVGNLTFGHHFHHDGLIGRGLKLKVGVLEGALEDALVRPGVVEGHVEDDDGAVLEVFGVIAAVPLQAIEETRVADGGFSFHVAVQLEENRSVGFLWKRSPGRK